MQEIIDKRAAEIGSELDGGEYLSTKELTDQFAKAMAWAVEKYIEQSKLQIVKEG